VTEIALPYFLALPSLEPPWPGVVVIHEGNGISPQLLRMSQRFAGEGYATIVPDLFFRTGGTEAADFATLMGALSREQTLADIAAAADRLREMGASSVGVTGFCMGGLWTYRAAVSDLGFQAAAGFYGARISGELGQPGCPTLLFFGGSDEYIPADEIEKVVAHHPETMVYPMAGHGFMRDGSSNHDEPAATDAWDRLLDFFSQHLS
jgi:carboxymethylenebutenolidase